ncbi:PadR family transcriptional regulator [Bauldia litoralis]|uniref:PadR family transcriptional regulator n=3 Tax=Bauldia litoralis TaxID=665467 RepID=UPI0032678486
MSAIRLLVLAALWKGGPMHGHQVKQAARADRTDLWTEVRPGSLYHALHRMAADGAIRPVRSETVGSRPERTVYEITATGLMELDTARAAAFGRTGLRPDPVDLALQTAAGMPDTEVAAAMGRRLDIYRAEADAWQEAWDAARPTLRAGEALAFRHTQLRLEAEIAWHREVLERLAPGA